MIAIAWALWIALTALLIGAAAGVLIQKARMARRNAVTAECVECPYTSGPQELQPAATAAAGHRTETGHHTMMVIAR